MMMNRRFSVLSLSILMLWVSLFTRGVEAQEALQIQQREKELLLVIDEELQEALRLVGQVRTAQPELLLRVAEGNLEKARIYRDLENNRYLSLPPEQRQQGKKASYFTQSTRYFQEAQKFCQVIIDRYPNFQQISDAYYIMAFNAKEFGKDQEARRYFALASQKAPERSFSQQKANLALAEEMLNNKEFAGARQIYEKSLAQGRKNRWWTKDAFNLAWCYYQLREYDQAIKLMREIYELSGQDRYVDMRSDVMQVLAAIYSDAGQMEVGIAYYQSKQSNIVGHLIRYAKKSFTSGELSRAETALASLEKITPKTPAEQVECLKLSRNLLHRLNRPEQHLLAVRKLQAINQESATREESTYQLKENVANQQKLLKDKTYDYDLNKQKEITQNVRESLLMLAELDPAQRAEYLFLIGETFYTAGQRDQALDYYIKSYELASAQKNSQYLKLSEEGMFACIGQDQGSEDLKGKAEENAKIKLSEKDLFVYQTFLKGNGSPALKKTILKRIYLHHKNSKNYAAAEASVAQYKQHFPDDRATLETMVTLLLEAYHTNGQHEQLVMWFKKSEQNGYPLAPPVRKMVDEYILGRQFKIVETKTAQGEWTEAVQGYLKIYQEKSDPKVKKFAAYNLMVIYSQQGEIDQAFQWGKDALNFLGPEDLKKYAKDYLRLVAALFERRRLDQLLVITLLLTDRLQGLTEVTAEREAFFKNTITTLIALEKDEELMQMWRRAQKSFRPPVLQETVSKILKYFISQKRIPLLEEVAIAETNYRPNILWAFSVLAKEYEKISDSERVDAFNKKLLAIYQSHPNKQEIAVEDLNAVAALWFAEMNQVVRELNAIELTFPEEVYNSRLRQKYLLLDQLTKKGNEIVALGAGEHIVRSYHLLIKSYQAVIQEVGQFKLSDDKDASYRQGFQEAMAKVTAPLQAKIPEYRATVIKVLQENRLAIDLASEYLSKWKGFYPRFTNENFVLMDRKGQQ